MRTAFTARHVLYALLASAAVTLIFGIVAVPRANASAFPFEVSTIALVPPTSLFPPSPCREGITISGQFLIRAHVTVTGQPGQERMLANLHLDGRGITGLGLTTGDAYNGTMGGGQIFSFDTLSPAPFQYTPGFTLFPPNPAYPPSPCHTAAHFLVNLSTPATPTLDNPPTFIATFKP